MSDPASWPAWAYTFALVLSRCGAAVMLMPGLGESEPPAMLRMGMTLALVGLVLPGLDALPPPDGWAAAGAVGAELFTGLALGWLARCIAMALPIAGQLISFMTGLTSVIVPDPELGSSSALQKLLALAAPVLVLGTGLWMLPVAALSGSYALVAPGHLLPVADSAQAAVRAAGTAFALGLRLAGPFVLANCVWHVALGLMARLVPHLQIYFASVPGQVIGGLALLAVLATATVNSWTEAAQGAFAALPGL